MGQENGERGAQDVQHQRAEVQGHGVEVAAQGVQQQLQQVHSLRVAHDAAVDQHGIAAEEAAHRAVGQMAIQVDMVVVG